MGLPTLVESGEMNTDGNRLPTWELMILAQREWLLASH